VLEPTLTPADEAWIRQIKDILWDELSLNIKEFETKEEAEEFLNE
jgi:Fic family protein